MTVLHAGDAALRWAVHEARLRNAELLLISAVEQRHVPAQLSSSVYVDPPEEDVTAAREHASAALAKLRAELGLSSDAVGGAATTVGRVSAAADIGPAEPVRVPFADASPAEVRAALTAEDAEAFDRQWRALMAQATERLDLTEVQKALEIWRQVAWVTSTHGPEVYRRTLASAEERRQSGERAQGALPWAQLKAELGLPE